MTLEFKGIDDEDDLKRIDNLWVWLQSLPFSDLVSSWTGNKLCLHKNTNDYVQYVMCTCDNISVFILAFIRSNDKRISPKYAEFIWLGVKDKNEGDASYAIYFFASNTFLSYFSNRRCSKELQSLQKSPGDSDPWGWISSCQRTMETYELMMEKKQSLRMQWVRIMMQMATAEPAKCLEIPKSLLWWRLQVSVRH